MSYWYNSSTQADQRNSAAQTHSNLNAMGVPEGCNLPLPQYGGGASDPHEDSAQLQAIQKGGIIKHVQMQGQTQGKDDAVPPPRQPAPSGTSSSTTPHSHASIQLPSATSSVPGPTYPPGPPPAHFPHTEFAWSAPPSNMMPTRQAPQEGGAYSTQPPTSSRAPPHSVAMHLDRNPAGPNSGLMNAGNLSAHYPSPVSPPAQSYHQLVPQHHHPPLSPPTYRHRPKSLHHSPHDGDIRSAMMPTIPTATASASTSLPPSQPRFHAYDRTANAMGNTFTHVQPLHASAVHIPPMESHPYITPRDAAETAPIPSLHEYSLETQNHSATLMRRRSTESLPSGYALHTGSTTTPTNQPYPSMAHHPHPMSTVRSGSSHFVSTHSVPSHSTQSGKSTSGETISRYRTNTLDGRPTSMPNNNNNNNNNHNNNSKRAAPYPRIEDFDYYGAADMRPRQGGVKTEIFSLHQPTTLEPPSPTPQRASVSGQTVQNVDYNYSGVRTSSYVSPSLPQRAKSAPLVHPFIAHPPYQPSQAPNANPTTPSMNAYMPPQQQAVPPPQQSTQQPLYQHASNFPQDEPHFLPPGMHHTGYPPHPAPPQTTPSSFVHPPAYSSQFSIDRYSNPAREFEDLIPPKKSMYTELPESEFEPASVIAPSSFQGPSVNYDPAEETSSDTIKYYTPQ